MRFLTHKFLSLSVSSRDRSVKEESLETLQIIFLSMEKSREVIAQFLPGLVSTLYKVVTGDFKQGHMVFVGAFRLLGL